MSWLSRNDGSTKSPAKNSRCRRRNASSSPADRSPNAKNRAQRLEQDEVEAAVQPAQVGALQGRGLHHLAEGDAVRLSPRRVAARNALQKACDGPLA